MGLCASMLSWKANIDKCRYDCMDALARRLRPAKHHHRLPCGSTRSVAVSANEMRPPVFRGMTDVGRAAAEGNCRTPMTPRRTPVWQRRILMGTRCELPRFSGLILYDEHGRPMQSSSQNRAGHLISRASKYESTGMRRTTSISNSLSIISSQ